LSCWLTSKKNNIYLPIWVVWFFYLSFD